MAMRHHRVPESGDEYPLCQQQVAHLDRLSSLAQDHRHDWGLTGERLESQRRQLAAEVARVLVQAPHELRVPLHGAHPERVTSAEQPAARQSLTDSVGCLPLEKKKRLLNAPQ